MSFLEGLTLLLIYLRCTGYIRISWALVAIPVLVAWTVRNIRRVLQEEKIERFIHIQQQVCENCEDREDEEIEK